MARKGKHGYSSTNILKDTHGSTMVLSTEFLPKAKSTIYSTAIGVGMDIGMAIIIVASSTPRMAPFLVVYPLEATKPHITDTIFSTL